MPEEEVSMPEEEVLHGMSWEVFHARLEDTLRGFPDGGFVALDPPVPPGTSEPEPEYGFRDWLRRLFNRLRGHQPPRSRPLVQIYRDGETLDAECSGPVSGRSTFDFAWTPDQQRRLLELGWYLPFPLDDWHLYRWRAGDGETVPPQPEAARAAAALAIATLRDVYGMANPDGLTFFVNRQPPETTRGWFPPEATRGPTAGRLEE